MVRKDATSYTSPTIQYSSLRQDDFIDAQFKPPPKRIPWKAISLAVILLIFGSLLLITGSLLVSGYIDVKYSDRTWPLIILGALMFIPGSYHSYVAYYAFKGHEGYSFDDIPAYDDDYYD